MVEKLKNPESEAEETPEIQVEIASSESSEKDLDLKKENNLHRVTRRIRDLSALKQLDELKTIMEETQDILTQPEKMQSMNTKAKYPKTMPTMEQRIYSIAEGISDAIKTSNQEHEFNKFLEDSGLKKDFGKLLVADRQYNAPGVNDFQTVLEPPNSFTGRYRRSVTKKAHSIEDNDENEESDSAEIKQKSSKNFKFGEKIYLVDEDEDDKNKNDKQELVIPHKPDLKGLEEKYKKVLQIKIEDGKRKLDDIKKKITQEGIESSHKIAAPHDPENIQEEILKKEIELLEKTEDTVADIFNDQKRRQETLEAIIFDELNDVKGERINTLKEMHKTNKKHPNSVVKRQAPTPLSKPLLKTVEFIEKNFELEPEAVKKIKRSLEEKMGELFRHYDNKRNAEIKKRINQKDERKSGIKKPAKDDAKGDNDNEYTENSNTNQDRTTERNHVRKPNGSSKPSKSLGKHNSFHHKERESQKELKKQEEATHRSKKNDERQSKGIENIASSKRSKHTESSRRTVEESSIELVKEEKLETRELEKKLTTDHSQEKSEKRSEKKAEKEDAKPPESSEEENKMHYRQNEHQDKIGLSVDTKRGETDKKNPDLKEISLKNDQERRKHMLEHITSMVENMHSTGENTERLKRLNFDEDIIDDFLPERKSIKHKRRTRRDNQEILDVEEDNSKISSEKTEMVEKKHIGKIEEVHMKELEKIEEEKKSLEKKEEINEKKSEHINFEKEQLHKMEEINKKRLEEAEAEKKHAEKIKEISKKESIKIEDEKKHLEKMEEKIKKEEEKIELEKKHLEKKEEIKSKELQKIDEIDEKKEQYSQKIEEEKQKFESKKEDIKSKQSHSAKEDSHKKEVPYEKEEPKKIETKEKIKLSSETNEKDSEKNIEGGEKRIITPVVVVEESEIKGKETQTEQNNKAELEVERSDSIVQGTEASMPSTPSTGKLGKIRKNRKRVNRKKKINPTEGEEPSLKKRHLMGIHRSVDVENKKNSKIRKFSPKVTRSIFSKSYDSEIPLEVQESDTNKMMESEVHNVQPENAREEIKKDLDEIVQEKHFLGEGSGPLKKGSRINGENFSVETKKSHTVNKIKGQLFDMYERDEMKKGSDEELPKDLEVMTDIESPPELPIAPNGEFIRQGQQPKAIMNKEVNEDDLDNLRKAIKNSRKRRATFLNKHKSEEKEEEDDNLSSEERIQKFKQMVSYRNAPGKKSLRNEISHSGGGGMGADAFLQMAGSTMRVMFDDVIPEAYGQTKSKIQSMGISEYIKEFGKLVQQMRNLDQVFLNIGEAAVRGYIKGNKPEKGPYIQVISRKKRDILEEEEEKSEETNLEMQLEEVKKLKHDEPVFSTQNPVATFKSTKFDDDKKEYARLGTNQEVVTDKPNWNFGWTGSWFGGSTQQPNEEEKRKAEKMAQVEETSGMVLENRQSISIPVDEVKKLEITDSETTTTLSHLVDKNDVKPKKKGKKSKHMKEMKKIGESIDSYISGDLQESITPWIRTTKDFIQQALTTLQRQRQLSEILAKEGVNLINKDMNRNLGKREIGVHEPMLPVFHMSGPIVHKRDVNKQSDESLINQLKGLQPGVYVVPTEEMTNIRSEQILNESKQKSGTPNVVTLNIYYDKKNADGTVQTEMIDQGVQPKINQDLTTYYENKGWNSAIGHYDQNNQFVTPMGIPEMTLNAPLIPPVQINPVFESEPTLENIPNSRLVQYPSGTYHYPTAQKIIPSVVARSGQSMFSPMVYLQPEQTYLAQSPGTKRQWRDFKASGLGLPTPVFNSGWNLQYGALPVGTKKTLKSKLPISSYNTDYKPISDKKRSINNQKISPTKIGTGLPFWKFFGTAPEKTETRDDYEESKESEEWKENLENVSLEADSSEDIKVPSKQEKPESQENVSEVTEKENRRKRSVDSKEIPMSREKGKVAKRSYLYNRERFPLREHELLPDWFGAYKEIDNDIDELPSHIRRSHIVSTPWSDEEEELLSNVFDLNDDLNFFTDDDYYFSNDNVLPRLTRRPRSTDNTMVKSNMIFKGSEDNDLSKYKMMGMKSMTSKENSLEAMKGTRNKEDQMNKNIPMMQQAPIMFNQQQQMQQQKQLIQQQIQQQKRFLQQQLQRQQKLLQTSPQQVLQQPQNQFQQQLVSSSLQLLPNLPLMGQQLQQLQLPLQILPELMPNGTMMPSRNAGDDSFYSFFRYAYDSFLRVMKSMTGFLQ